MPSGSDKILKRIGDRRNAQKKRLQLKNWAAQYKGGKCVLCGYDRCIRAFEFHHLDPNEKDFTVSTRLGSSPESLRLELDKCVLVCANCHREIHDGLYPHLFASPDREESNSESDFLEEESDQDSMI